MDISVFWSRSRKSLHLQHHPIHEMNFLPPNPHITDLMTCVLLMPSVNSPRVTVWWPCCHYMSLLMAQGDSGPARTAVRSGSGLYILSYFSTWYVNRFVPSLAWTFNLGGAAPLHQNIYMGGGASVKSVSCSTPYCCGLIFGSILSSLNMVCWPKWSARPLN